ncbi:MAG TPA: hypothetical protein PKY83_07955 [Bacteroidales bacterium]|jgi:hypothetical protein|nr:hypothetical protein [Bacteroidales bacterium]MCZ2417487.1 hypothetical protein [Burkholderiales bacterium]OQC57280.1 MAG: hypothetical protein BWX52_01077 [Bacteroidetes bacterium ADurb.Bin013]MBV6455906.1 hypothetical protein [Bacteroidales bacterium]MCZ2316399.1 hypothetical protein [Bacteroidales bacterium]
MKNLLIVCALILTACGAAGRIPWEEVRPLLSTEDSVQLYEFQMLHMNGTEEGLLLVSMNTVNRPRLVLTSFFGMSLFDLEGTAEGYQVHYVMDVLNRSRMLDLLWDDFSLLFEPYSRKGFPPVRNDDGAIVMLMTGNGILHTVIRAGDHVNGYPSTILIDHPALRLSVRIKVLQDAEESLCH